MAGDNQSSKWSVALPAAILSMNSQVHSVTKQAPYTVVFNQPVKGNRVFISEREGQEILEQSVNGSDIDVLDHGQDPLILMYTVNVW